MEGQKEGMTKVLLVIILVVSAVILTMLWMHDQRPKEQSPLRVSSTQEIAVALGANQTSCDQLGSLFNVQFDCCGAGSGSQKCSGLQTSFSGASCGTLSCVVPGLCITPPLGLVSWWDADATSGTTAVDLIGTNNGILVNGTTLDVGHVGLAYSFDGVDDYVEIPSSPSLDAGAFTLDAWVYIDSETIVDDEVLISRNDVGAEGIDGHEGYSLFLRRSGGIGAATVNFDFFTSSDDVSGGIILSGGQFLQTAGWHHLAVTRTLFKDGATLKSNIVMYIDGVLSVAFNDVSTDIVSPEASLVIGQRSAVTNEDFFSGLIDEVEFFNRALSASEVQALFNAGSAGKCK